MDEFHIFPQTQYANSPADVFTFNASIPDPITSGPEGMSIYIKYLLTNKGSNDITDMYMGIWSDPDLGDAGDDLVGCDPEDDLFFCYNATNEDSRYFVAPPAIGYKIIHGPVVPAPGEVAWFDGEDLPNYRNLGLTGFQFYINGTDPNHYTETYDYLSSPTFDFSGDPVTGSGDLDFDSSDRRMMGSTGPFSMAPGESQVLLLKLAVGQGVDYLASITSLREILNNVPEAACPFVFTATNSSGAFLGQATINGLSAEPGDCVAAFDEDGNCAGAADIVIDKAAYINLQIYGDDPTTAGIDEGMNAGESFTLKIYDASEEMILEYPLPFDCWTNTQGAPLEGACGDHTNVYDFPTTDDLMFGAGWNLISIDVGLGGSTPAECFACLGDNLIYVTGFDGGSVFYDPSLPDFLNTLTSIDPGCGYWVKVTEPMVGNFVGPVIPSDFAIDSDEGWNLIGYWPQFAMTPAEAFAALVSGGQLIYVTGFDGGAMFYDPSLPDFLNTLGAVENGFGYWVKTTEAIPGFTYPVGGAPTGEKRPSVKATAETLGPFTFAPTNLSGAFVGTVRLQEQPCEAVDIIAAFDEGGNCAGAAYLTVNEGVSYIALPVYGDDPTTDGVDEGIGGGEGFTLALYDASTDQVFTNAELFTCWANTNGAPLPGDCGNYLLLYDTWTDVAGPSAPSLPASYALYANYPNPFNPSTVIQFDLPRRSDVSLAVYNILGKKVKELVDKEMPAGTYSVDWNGDNEQGKRVSSGMYFYRLTAGDFEQTKKMVLIK